MNAAITRNKGQRSSASAKRGDARATFDRWVTDHRGLFFKVVRAFAATQYDQDDLFQEIAVAIWRSVPEFRGDSKESTWIYRVALFTAIDWSRSENRRPATQTLDTDDNILLAQAPPDPRVDWLYERIRELEPLDRSLTLLILDGYTHAEVGALLGMSQSNVGVRIHRVKKRLAKATQVENYDESR